MDGLYEKAAIASTFDSKELHRRVQVVCGDIRIGSPEVNNPDSVRLRERFGLVVEYKGRSAICSGDDVSAHVLIHGRGPSDMHKAARKATMCVIAAHYIPPVMAQEGKP